MQQLRRLLRLPPKYHNALVHPTEVELPQQTLSHSTITSKKIMATQPSTRTSTPTLSSTVRPTADFPDKHTHQKELGEGSESYVDLWKHNDTGRLMAVKTLRLIHIRTDGLPNEVSILKDLPVHPKIIRCEAFYPKNGRASLPCIIFEYLPEGDMFTIRELSCKNGRNGIFSEAFMWSIYSQLTEALAFLHEGIGTPEGTNTDNWNPVLHRDIKLENVFVKTLGTKPDWSSIEIKLGDFGLATRTETALPKHLGTPEYWPPEMTFSDRRYGPEADIWAIGAIIHELAHGFTPIVDPTATAQVILARRTDMLPADWASRGPRARNWVFNIVTTRKVWPINLDAAQQAPDRRRKRPCPKYSDVLNACMMMALQMQKEQRLTASALAGEVAEAYGEFLYAELQREMESVMDGELVELQRIAERVVAENPGLAGEIWGGWLGS